MHTKIKFIKQAILNYSQIGAILPSSRFLARYMVKDENIEKSSTIVELGAGTGIFTKEIFKLAEKYDNKEIFIIEKDRHLYESMLKKFSDKIDLIYNNDMLNLEEIINERGFKNIDLIVSGIPFRSLPRNLFIDMMEKVLPNVISKNTIFVQFSYIKSTKVMFEKYFDKVETEVCLLNIPSAFVFTCRGFKGIKKEI